MHTATGLPRRDALRTVASAVASAVTFAAGAAVLGGCGVFDDDPPPPERPDPLAPLLADTVAVIARYDAALAAHPDLAARLTPVREAHAAHAAELAALIGASPSPSAAPSGTPTGATPADARGTLAALRAAEVTGRREAAAACLAAPPERAALLGSMAAARATHAEALA